MKHLKSLLPAMLLMAGLLLTLHISARAASKAKPGDLSGLFGINGIGYFHYRNAPDAAKTAQTKMELLHQAGVTWDRFDFWWSEMEPQHGVWKWDKADWLIDFYTRNHIQMLPILSYRAAWMKQQPHTPEDFAEFADYTKHVVERYHNRVHAWEIWNEPNIPTFWKVPSAHDYTAMMKAAYLAAHKADPHCTIVGAAANETDINWLRGIAKNGGMPYMDAVSIHPYTMADGPEEMQFARQIENVKTFLKEQGRPNLPIWITEMGWTSGIHDPAAMDKASRYMAQSYVIAAAEGVRHLFWFQLQDWRENGKLQGWGLVSPEYIPKKTMAAYTNLSKTLGDTQFAGYIPLRGGTGYVFQNGKTKTIVAWAHRNQTITLPVESDTRATDIYGQPVAIPGRTMTVSASPIMLENIPGALLAKATMKRPAPASDNLVVNGSLSEADAKGAYGWHKGVFYGGNDKGTFATDLSAPHQHALSLSQTTDALWQSWPVPAMPGERYTLTAQLKTANATGDNGVQILFLSGPGWGWKGGPTSPTLVGTSDGWQTVMVTGTVPDDADVVRINLVSKNNTGTVLFRDIKLTRQAAGH